MENVNMLKNWQVAGIDEVTGETIKQKCWQVCGNGYGRYSAGRLKVVQYLRIGTTH